MIGRKVESKRKSKGEESGGFQEDKGGREGEPGQSTEEKKKVNACCGEEIRRKKGEYEIGGCGEDKGGRERLREKEKEQRRK